MGRGIADKRAESDLIAEASSIEFSVKYAEQMANCPDSDSFSLTVRKPWACDQATVNVSPISSPFVISSFMKRDRVWPRLSGRTSHDLIREARYQMYHVYESYPEEMRKLIIDVLLRGCPDLDDKGVKDFVSRVWKNERLQENLQGALNAMYYRELFDGEEKRLLKRSVPEIYLEDGNPALIFNKMKTFLFRNRDTANVIYMVKTRKNRCRPLSTQLYDIFESEKRATARRRSYQNNRF